MCDFYALLAGKSSTKTDNREDDPKVNNWFVLVIFAGLIKDGNKFNASTAPVLFRSLLVAFWVSCRIYKEFGKRHHRPIQGPRKYRTSITCSARPSWHNKSLATQFKILFGFSFSSHNFVEIFAGVIGALDEYSILMQVRSTLSISFKLEQSCHFHSCTSARGQKLQVSFF